MRNWLVQCLGILASPTRLFVVLCSALPIIFIALYIDRNAINIPFFDDWYCCLPAAVQAKAGTLSVDALFNQHNNHRIVFTHLTDIMMTWTTDWDLKAELYITLGIALCILGLAIYLARQSTTAPITWILLLPFSLLVFSFRQNFSWLQALINAMLYCLLFTLLAIVLIVRSRIALKTVFFASILALCALFSFLSGLITWFVLPLTMWMRGYRHWRYYAFWVAAAALAFALFFSNYDFGAVGVSESSGVLQDPLSFVLFILIYIGAPFITPVAEQLPLVLTIGALGLILLALNFAFILLKTRSWSSLNGWISLALFVIGTGIITGLGRSAAYGAYSAAAPRYVTTSSLFWLAFIVLSVYVIVGMARAHRWQRGLAIVNAVFLFTLVPTYLHANYTTLTYGGWVVHETDRRCALLYLVTRIADCLPPLVNNTEEMNIEPQLVDLFRTRLSVYAQPVIDLSWLPLDVSESQPQAHWTEEQIDGITVPVLAQPASSNVQQTLLIPDGSFQPTISAALFVLSYREQWSDEVAFRLSVEDQSGVRTMLMEGEFDANVDQHPNPISADLSAFVGQSIVLIYETQSSGAPIGGWAAWIAPRLDLGST